MSARLSQLSCPPRRLMRRGDLPTCLAARLRAKPLVYHANEIFSETHARVRFAWFWRMLDRLLVPALFAVLGTAG